MYLVSVTFRSEDGCSSYAKLPIENEDWTRMGVNDKGMLVGLLGTSALSVHNACPECNDSPIKH